jgi:hypothetical protein
MNRKRKNQIPASVLFVANAFLTAGILSPARAIAAPAPILLSPASTGSAAYDFGKVNQGSTAPLLHKFFLKNANATPVVVERVQVSCGCTTATLGGGATLPDTLGAGKVLEVDTSVDLLRLYAGAVEKSVAVYLVGQAAPAATLEITGTLVPSATFSPDLLNFGDVPYGDTPTQKLVATIDKKAVPSLDAVQFESTDSDITADRVSVTPFGDNEETVEYQVKVSPTPYIGIIDGTVSLMVRNVSNGMSLIGSSVPIHGNIIGGFSSSPQSITFANAPAGKAATQQILLTGISTADIPKLTLFSASPLIELKAETPDPNAKPSKVIKVDVNLSDKMQVGSLQTQIIITAPDGSRMLLPVLVFCTTP